MDDGADKISEFGRWTHFQRFRLGDQCGFDGRPEIRREEGAGRGAAFLTLVFEGAADGVDGCVVGIGARVDEVVILAPRFAHDAWVSSIFAVCDVGSYFAVQAAENGRAARVVQAGEVAVAEDGGCDFDGVAGDELDHVGGETGFEEDAVDDVVGGDGRGGGLPDDDVTHQGRGAGQVAADGCKVEGRDGVHEAFEGTVFDTVPNARRVVDGLLGVQILGILHVEAEEITQFCGGVDFGLPCILPLSEHRGCHYLVSVFSTDQVCGFEEDGGAVGEGEGFPCWFGGEGGVDGTRDVGGTGVRVFGDDLVVVGGIGLME